MTDLSEAQDSVGRIQKFDTASLPRREDLGLKFAFDEAVEPARRLVSLFRKLPVEALSEFPPKQLQAIKSQADQVFNLFDQVLKFDETQADAANLRTNLISKIDSQYEGVFGQIFPFISFAVS